MAKNTSNRTVRSLVELLYQYGVRRAVLSPGSRNTPLIMAFERHPDIDTVVVIDERVAAFVALGMSMAEDASPVAICCTSGTAPLNYAPALAEAYYRGLPLIAVTADRPEEWIDKDDSQTIRQPGIFANFIKSTVNLPVDTHTSEHIKLTESRINEAMQAALSPRRGPVHINVQLDDPLGAEEDCQDTGAVNLIETPEKSDLAEKSGVDKVDLQGRKILILAGFQQPGRLSTLFERLVSWPNVVIMHEAQSNVGNIPGVIGNIDATLSCTTKEQRLEYAPDVVITFGGAQVSRYVKGWLRGLDGLQHIAVSDSDYLPDTFRKLTARVKSISEIEDLLANVALTSGQSSEYKSFWIAKSHEGRETALDFARAAGWSDFKAMNEVFRAMPLGLHLQLSNGTAIRYAQLLDYSKALTVQSNRGVSGIDGSTSTAIGSAHCNDAPTMLITGDMSFAYDIGALALNFIPPTFKIIVLNNGGGNIFRFITSTATLPEVERCFATDLRLPLPQLCEGYGFRYFKAADYASLCTRLPEFFNHNTSPALLDITTDGELSAEIFRQFFKSK